MFRRLFRRPFRGRVPLRSLSAAAVLVGVGGLAVLSGRAEEARPEPLVVVELFTSQGCSSCPPADALLADLAARPDVLALSLHVDYWDYLGWKDIFAMPAFTRRQVAYGETADARSVYTPQMIVQGTERLVGSHRKEVLGAIAEAAASPRVAQVSLSRTEDGLQVRVAPVHAASPGGVLWYVTFHTPDPVLIKSGENAGREVRYVNVARSWMKLGRWDGRSETVYAAPDLAGAGADSGVAVILQAGRYGPVLAAAKLDR